MYSFLSALLLAGVASVTVLSFADAAPVMEDRVAIVSTQGLDLSKPQDVAVLAQRVHATVNHMCGHPASFDLEELNAIKACRAEGYASAKGQVQAAIRSASHAVQAVSAQPVRVSAAQ